MKKEQEKDINFKELLQNKKWIFLLPMVCTLFVFYKSYKLIGLFINDLFQTIRTMKQEERNNYVEKFSNEKSKRYEELNLVILSFIAMCIYYFTFGDQHLLNVFTNVCLRIVYFTFIELGNVFTKLFTHYQIYKGM
ncbi:MAG: hypothetical protein K2W92_02540 [Alphaproteobacteria bacterium]|nr:hypothetical protein [Alphaproteobacteria bacterium]